MTEWVWATADGVVSARNGRLLLRAEGIRNQRTGKHATITVSIDGHDLAGDLFNYERLSERERLGRKAWAELALEEQREYPVSFLNDAIWRFSLRIWQEHVKVSGVEEAGADNEPPPPTFVLAPYIIEGGGTILFAPPGRGKSYTALLMAVSVDAGCSRIWQVDVPRPTLFLNLERAKLSLKRRLALVNLALGLEAHRPLLFINARGKGLREVEEAARRSVAKHGVEVVFMDSISRAGLGSLVEDRPANAIIDTLSRICPTWVALAHTPRQDETHAYGSQMMDAGEDVGVQLITQTSNNGTLGIGLKVVKANDIAIPSLQVLVYTFDEYGLSGARIAKHGEFPEIEAKRRMTVQEQVREYLLQVGEVSATAVSQQLGISRQTISKVMSADTWLTRRRHGHEVLYSVSECQLSEGG